MNIQPGTIIRTLCLALALINQLLSAAGHSPLPLQNETLSQFLTAGCTILTALWAWWKNNSFTQSARQADQSLRRRRVFNAVFEKHDAISEKQNRPTSASILPPSKSLPAQAETPRKTETPGKAETPGETEQSGQAR